MSGISSGIGLISGINTAQIIDQLIALESRPVQTLQSRVQAIDTQRTAIAALSAKLLALKDAVSTFDRPSFFDRFNAASSNEQVAAATARASAIPGAQTFRVLALATNHSVLSRGFADADRTPLGVGTLSIELGRGRVDPPTILSGLNNGRGVGRGSITITDRAGNKTNVDLSRAYSVEDILSAINNTTGIGVRASVTGLASNGVTGDRLVIEDISGGTGNLSIVDQTGSTIAAGLGIAQSVAGPRIDGRNLVQLDSTTLLSTLNDGNGIGRATQASVNDDIVFETTYGTFGVTFKDILAPGTTTNSSVDLRALNGGNGVRLGVIRITDRAGKAVDIDLANAPVPLRTVNDVRQYVNQQATAAGVGISLAPVNSHLQIADTTGVTGTTAKNLKVEDVSGFAAADLGIAGDVATNAITGRDIHSVSTLGDVVNAINFAEGNAGFVQARISDEGKGIAITALGLDNAVTVKSGISSSAARDLGLENAVVGTGETYSSRRLVAGLNTVLLNSIAGGKGVVTGQISVTNSANQTTALDFSSAHTLQDVIEIINSNPTLGVRASINAGRNGLQLTDTAGGTNPLNISDAVGTLAAELGIAGTFDVAAGSVNGKNVQVQYVSRQTLLKELNNGQDVSPGRFRISAAGGATYTVNISNNTKTVGDLIDAVNLVGGGNVSARINDTGDGILISDSTTGQQRLKIEDIEGGTIAKNFRLAGEAKAGQSFVDGSFEIRVDIGAGETLRSLATRLNNSGLPFSATVLQSGVGPTPFSLSITSNQSGRGGELLISGQGVDLGFTTLARAQDALLSVGGSDAASGLLVANSSNTFDNILEGVKLDVLSTSNDPVTINVTQDVDDIVESVQRFVDLYNEVQAELDQSASFDSETLERGALFGDTTVSVIRQRLSRIALQPFAGGGAVSRLFSIGIRVGGNNRLQFDAAEFREAYEANPAEVERFFTAEENGFGDVVKAAFDDLTRSIDGVIARKDEQLINQQDLLKDRIDQLNILLAGKRSRLERQFAGLESSLAALQDQQSSLNALAQLAAGG